MEDIWDTNTIYNCLNPSQANIIEINKNFYVRLRSFVLHVGMEYSFWKTEFTRFVEPDNTKNWFWSSKNIVLH